MRSAPEFQDDLALSVEELIALKDVQHQIGDARTTDEVLRILLRAISRIVRTDEIVLCLVDDDRTEFRICKDPERGHIFPLARRSTLPDNDIIRWIVGRERPSTVPVGPDRLMTIVPLTAQARLLGLVYIDSRADDESITRQVQELLSLLANQAASVLLGIRLQAQLQQQLAAVSRSTGFLRNIIESINHGVITVNRDLDVEQVNRNALVMLDLPWGPDAVGKKLAQVLPPEVLEVVEGITRETLENGFAMERQMDVNLGSGPKINIAVSTSLWMDEGGGTQGVVIILRDMTASMELERLRRLDTMKSEFVANVSHELRTPLTSIKAYTEALKDMVTEDETAAKFLNVVEIETDRLIALIENLLNASLIEAGNLKLKLELVHPPEIVEEILHVSKVQSEKHPLTTVFAKDLPMMLMDKSRMKEVMVNLIGNAIKYSPDGGAITVTMAVEEGNLRIDVADRGMGISAEHRPKIFDRFYRVDNSMTYKVSGTGLGLSIVKKVVEAHEGAIGVDENPGGGSKFTIHLPIRTRTKPKFD